jgi:LPS-assembly protein
MRRFFLCVVILLSLLQSPVSGGEKTEIEAPWLEWVPEGRYYLLEGGVRLKRADAILSASDIKYWPDEEVAEAEGDVKYEDASVIIEAERARFDLKTEEGIIFNARIFFKRDSYRITAERLEKTGKKTYLLENLTFTTCDTPFSAWCFFGREAFLKEGDSIRAKSVSFRIKGVPVLYSPYIWSPILNERKTGFLMPEIGLNSDKGFQWRQPFYLVISKNRDMTFYLDLYSRRGIGSAFEYRYIERGFGRGKWWFYYLRDWYLGKNFVEVKAEHRLVKERGVSGFVDLNLVNREEFHRLYSHRIEIRTNRFLESTAEVSYGTDRFRLYLNARFWQDITEDGETGQVLQRLPEVGFSLNPLRYRDLYFTFNTRATYFYSEDLYKTLRFDIIPRIYYSTGDLVRFTQQLGFIGSFYSITNTDEYPDSIQRMAPVLKTRLHLMLTKRYGEVLNILEPEILYRFIPDTGKTPPLLDSTELLERLSLVQAGIKSSFYDRKGFIGSFRITSAYDFHESNKPFSDIRLEGGLGRPFSLSIDISYSIHEGYFSHINYRIGRYFNRFSFYVGQRYSKDDSILFYTGGLKVEATSRLELGSSVWYDAKGEGLRDLKLSVSYDGGCWFGKVLFSRRPDEYSFKFLIRLKGLGELSLGDFI